MTEPIGELFAAASAVNAARLADEKKQEQKLREELEETAERQKLADQKKAADRKQSDERAAAFIEIMQAKQIPPVDVINFKAKFVEWKTTSSGSDKHSSFYHPVYETTFSKFGEGWFIQTTWNNPDTKLGLVLLDNLYAYEASIRTEESFFDKKAVVLTQSYTKPKKGEEDKAYTEKPPLDSPFAGESGLNMLGKALDMYGIVQEDNSSEEIE